MVSIASGEVVLTGCAPEPLMDYLKALGVFRLVAEQKDASARAFWCADTFVLRTTLDRDALVRFFLEDYRPTPVIAPWNGGSGFYPMDNQAAIEALRSWADDRLGSYQDAIIAVRDISVMDELLRQFENAERIGDPQARKAARSEAKKARNEAKDEILNECRNRLSDDSIRWMDAAYVLTIEGPRYPPLLGSGGNDGRLEFSNNFMQNLLQAFTGVEAGKKPSKRIDPKEIRQEWLRAALLNDASPPLTGNSIGQFNPGGVGGPNASAGFDADSLINPWDYVLMIEGALFFAGAVARRYSTQNRTKAVFPFTADTTAAGYGTAVDTEYTSDGSRAELWAPLWHRPATHAEITHLFTEGRAQLGRSQASTGTDFARAAVGLGVEQGVSSFQRYGFLKRNGRAFLATPVGRIRVRTERKANLLFDIDRWLGSFRRAASGQKAPVGAGRALRRIEAAILEFCARGEARRLQDVLIALGHAEAWLAKSGLTERVRPLYGLSPAWLKECDDESHEFRLATAIAPIQGAGDVPSIRANLEPVTWGNRGWEWAERNPSVVWHSGDVLRALAAVLERRCLEATMKDLARLPLWGRVSASLADIQAFLEGRVDERRMADLVLTLSAINWPQRLDDPFGREPFGEPPPMLPQAYAALKLLFLPRPFKRHENAEEKPIRFEPAVLAQLRSGNAEGAYEVATRRLRVSGFPTLIDEASVPHRLVSRLSASLLFPIRPSDDYRLGDMVLVPPSDNR